MPLRLVVAAVAVGHRACSSSCTLLAAKQARRRRRCCCRPSRPGTKTKNPLPNPQLASSLSPPRAAPPAPSLLPRAVLLALRRAVYKARRFLSTSMTAPKSSFTVTGGLAYLRERSEEDPQ